MASAGAHLPLWDKNNVEQQKFIDRSEWDKLLIQATPDLKEKLKLDDVWAHLQALGVLQLTDVERIQNNRSRPDMVEALVKHIRKGGTLWQYHALMRAMALTEQGHLILGTETAEYYPEQDQAAASQLDTFRLSQQLLKDIWDHCGWCKKTLMTSHVFTFEGDPGDDIINTADSFIKVHPKMKDAVSNPRGGEMVQMEGSKLLEPLGDSPAPVTIRLYADPGDGKTSFARYTVYSWCIDFLKQLNNKGGKLCLKSGCTKWTMMVFLCARDIKTTVEAAIREQLGCKNTDVLMAHIIEGQGVVIFIDAYDECRNSEILEKIHKYVCDCQKGGPTVVIMCRTNLCDIAGKHFDRFVTLSGFTDEQGLRYIKLYTELCQPHLPQPSQAPHVYEYAMQHKAQLAAVLRNPLKLKIFAALGLRGKIDLSAGSEFHVPSLFIPLEEYLLDKQGVKPTKEQSQAFYRVCIYALLNDIREFSESLLQEFSIVKPYHAFMVKSVRRNSTGKLESYYTFGHEMVLEFFASRYIFSLNDEEIISFLLVICHGRSHRNVQKIIFELLAQEGNAQIELLQTMVRFILILQFDKSRWTLKKTLYDLMHLQGKIKTDIQLSDMLRSKDDKITIAKAADINKKIQKAFETNADTLRSSNWFTRLNDSDNGTIRHVVDCVQACAPDVQEQLIHNTIHVMLPCREDSTTSAVRWCYAVGGTRWAEVKTQYYQVNVSAWCPGDAAEAVMQHAATRSGWSDKVLYIHTDRYTGYSKLWGQPGGDRCTQQEWDRLLQVLPQGWGRGLMRVFLHDTAPVTGLLSCLLHHAVHLSQWEVIRVVYGTAELEDLVTCVSQCTEADIKVELCNTHIVVPERLRAQKDKLHQLKDALTGVLEDDWLWGPPRWVTETGEKYDWSDDSDKEVE